MWKARQASRQLRDRRVQCLTPHYPPHSCVCSSAQNSFMKFHVTHIQAIQMNTIPKRSHDKDEGNATKSSDTQRDL